MSTQGISFAQFQRLAPRIIRSRKPIMGHGAHGIGKSMIVYQLAPKLAGILGPEFQAKYGKNYNFPVIERRASQMADTGDVIGVPEPKDSEHGRVTTFAPMAWFARACHEPCILFFDEVDRANNDVRQSLMELTDSRKIAGHFLHPDTIIIAMVNGGNHDKNNAYQVSELDPAEHDRWWHCDLEPTVEDWLEWAKENVLEVTWDFVNNNRGHLEHTGEIEPHKVYPSRRSWHHFDKCLQTSKEAGDDLLEASNEGKLPMDLYFVGEGFIGQEASIAFKDFVEKYEKQVSVDDVLQGRKAALIKAFQVNDSNAMIDKLADCEKIKEGLTDSEILNLAKFIHTIQAELAMKAWEKITKLNPDVVKTMWGVNVTPELTFGNYIASVVGASDED
tara:strand:- start:1346 stop:2515 length:1170 start_codon:yes stop_codon:yes gene_type:complete